MKILFFGDSITDAERNRTNPNSLNVLGSGYVRSVADRLAGIEPAKYEIINTGIGGNRVVDLYARVKSDVWNHNPDLVSIMIGINDIWHEIDWKNGVDIERFEKVYRALISDTKKALPNVQIILCEPFVLEGKCTCATDADPKRYEKFLAVYEYAKIVKKLAEEFACPYLPLQEKFNRVAEKGQGEYYLLDGVHPQVAGAGLIADEWVKLFLETERI